VPADGGYINSPAAFLTELDRNLVQFSPIRSVARVSTVSVGEVILPKRTAGPTAHWVGETAGRSSAQPTYAQQPFSVKEAACYVDVSNRLIEDAAFDIEAELAFDLGEEFGRLESAAFWNGAGGDEPTGLMSAGIQSVHSANSDAISAEDIIDLFHALPGAYAANATWAMNRTTIGAVRKLKASDGHFLWTDALTAGNPATILGRPVIECPEADDVLGGNSPQTTFPIVFGDWSHFRVFDRVATSILRDPYSIQTSGQVRFHARRRLTGGVSKTEAFRILEVG
jgi:HK97 family phage major capsid protein